MTDTSTPRLENPLVYSSSRSEDQVAEAMGHYMAYRRDRNALQTLLKLKQQGVI